MAPFFVHIGVPPTLFRFASSCLLLASKYVLLGFNERTELMGLWNENNQVVSFLSFCFFFFQAYKLGLPTGGKGSKSREATFPNDLSNRIKLANINRSSRSVKRLKTPLFVK